ncbi:hypothetical protein [Aneurinibacillus migulanus]|uniref:hypothetical protein n=1 Tax=Aneurinibacillus migulanus TaxID=47500 RepID=UPI00209C7232|nr:hypothetical protein [Aneurinibacillus migulanus]MCP1357740.1 hypothetical protein [Aneurinibacillus migulanus]
MTRSKYSEEFVRDYLEQHGYKLIGTYKNTFTRFLCVCPNGHEYSALFKDFYHRGIRCRKCASNQKYTLDEIRDIYAKEGCTVINPEAYKNRYTVLKFICSCGGHGETTLQYFMFDGIRCSECRAERMRQTKRNNRVKRANELIGDKNGK